MFIGLSHGSPNGPGSITKAGSEPVRTALVEAAWAYRFKPAIGLTLRSRQRDASPDTLARSWKAQRHLNSKYKAMTSRGKPPAVAITAVARELAGFVWAEMTSRPGEGQGDSHCDGPRGHDRAHQG